MYEFIVLGLIPGTHLQITFAYWIIAMICLGVSSIIWLEHQRHPLRNLLIAVSLLVVLRRIPARS